MEAIPKMRIFADLHIFLVAMPYQTAPGVSPTKDLKFAVCHIVVNFIESKPLFTLIHW